MADRKIKRSTDQVVAAEYCQTYYRTIHHPHYRVFPNRERRSNRCCPRPRARVSRLQLSHTIEPELHKSVNRGVYNKARWRPLDSLSPSPHVLQRRARDEAREKIQSALYADSRPALLWFLRRMII